MPRHFQKKVSLRFSDDQMSAVLQAVAMSDDAWRGVSHHARAAVLAWAKSELAKARERIGRRAS